LLKAKPQGDVAELMRPFVETVGPFDPETGRPASYPGSPAIAQHLLRAHDRIALCETHPEERERLIAALGRDERLRISGLDGYVALNAYVPPKERRGVALIDPPYEMSDESDRVATALARAISKWPRGIYMLWRPIKDRAADARFLKRLEGLAAPNMLRLEIDVGAVAPGPHSPSPLHSAGLLIVNPPFGLFEEAGTLMPFLTKLLTRAGRGAFVLDWLTPPT
jgi:23S rRNA (adenine2030-N6)-methyltransferase